MSKKILLTGGTGFFGKSILDMVRRKELTGYDFTILSRDPEKFLQANPQFANSDSLKFISGDVRDFAAPETEFNAMILGATPASIAVSDEEMSSIIIDGTAHSLEVAAACQVKKILFLSSGAVYGKYDRPAAETDICTPVTAYGKSKLEAEKMCFDSGIPAVIARCFTFTGKFLDRNIHFAIGNFIRDALAGIQITVNGDGTPMRSYLYADDLVRWLFNLLESAKPGTICNVGSKEAVSIADLAQRVAETLAPETPVKILSAPLPENGRSWYVPDISFAEANKFASQRTALTDAVKLSAE